jgi:hypothetical protein
MYKIKIRPSIVYACVNPRGEISINTVTFSKKTSIARLIDGTSETWEYLRDIIGWKCMKLVIQDSAVKNPGKDSGMVSFTEKQFLHAREFAGVEILDDLIGKLATDRGKNISEGDFKKLSELSWQWRMKLVKKIDLKLEPDKKADKKQ